MSRIGWVPGATMIAMALTLAACDGDGPTPPTEESIVGTYEATSLVTTADGESVDQLAEGLSLTITLTAENTTTGRFIVPAEANNGEALDEDLSGTWSLSGRYVSFEHDADTFIRDMPFEVRGHTLVGDKSFEYSATRVRITLTRVP